MSDADGRLTSPKGVRPSTPAAGASRRISWAPSATTFRVIAPAGPEG